MTTEQFYKQEQRMENFINWLGNTVHYAKEMNQNEYEKIFNQIKNKAVYDEKHNAKFNVK